MNSTDKAKARWRYDQAMVDADIESLPRIPDLEAIIAGWDEVGISDEERLARLAAYFQSETPRIE